MNLVELPKTPILQILHTPREREIVLSRTLRAEAQSLLRELRRIRDELVETRLKSEQLRSDLSNRKKQLLAGKS